MSAGGLGLWLRVFIPREKNRGKVRTEKPRGPEGRFLMRDGFSPLTIPDMEGGLLSQRSTRGFSARCPLFRLDPTEYFRLLNTLSRTNYKSLRLLSRLKLQRLGESIINNSEI